MNANKARTTHRQLLWQTFWASGVSLFASMVWALEWLLPPNLRSNRRRRVGRKRRGLPPTRDLDDVTRAKRAQILIQGLIERTPADPGTGTSPPVLVQLKRVYGRPTVVLYSPSPQYQAQIFKAVESSKDIDMEGSNVGLASWEDLSGVAVKDLESRFSSLEGLEVERESELPATSSIGISSSRSI